jgi:hypothetical protein
MYASYFPAGEESCREAKRKEKGLRMGCPHAELINSFALQLVLMSGSSKPVGNSFEVLHLSA